ncbi:MAG: hypothetical protein ACLFV5_03750 [Anaerolineales bacterium]
MPSWHLEHSCGAEHALQGIQVFDVRAVDTESMPWTDSEPVPWLLLDYHERRTTSSRSMTLPRPR